MSAKRLMTTIGGTVLSVLGIGYFMLGDGGAKPATAPRPAPVQQAIVAPEVAASADADQPLDLSNVALTSTQVDVAPPRPMPVPELEDAAAGATLAGTRCEVSASASPAAGALAQLEISAPCYANERVTIYHSGLAFTETTDDQGHLGLRVPPLAEKAVFIVAFANGKGAVASTRIEGLDRVDRVALQWRGDSGFELHALEFGAGYDDPGHVWFGADAGRNGAAGFMTRLGNPDTLAPQMVDIYTFPTAGSDRSGSVALSVEAEVTGANCGKDITAQSLELRSGGALRTRDLVLAVPGCDAVGDFLVLNNLVDDLKIAAK